MRNTNLFSGSPLGAAKFIVFRTIETARRRGRKGTAALEFALASPLLVVTLGGAADLGMMQYNHANLASAVAAGATYASLTGTSVSTANITSVITNTMFLPSGGSANLSVTYPYSPGWYCVVSGSGGNTVTASTQSGTCSDSSSPGYYLQISATWSSSGLMSAFWTSATGSVTETAWVRLQ